MNSHTDLLIRRVVHEIKQYDELLHKEWIESIEDGRDDIIKIMRQKYPSLKGVKKNSKKTIYKATFIELLKEPYFKDNFTDNEIESLYKMSIIKIKAIIKLAQSDKTAICNDIINKKMLDSDNISICITHLTLTAQQQWFERLYKDIKKAQPSLENLNEMIMVISSKKPNFDNIIHCKTIYEATSLLGKPNHNIKIIFVVSHGVRLSNIYENILLNNNSFENKKKFTIIHDEAHHPAVGVPGQRGLIERILMDENVTQYIPVTATSCPIYDPSNPMWKEKNIKNNMIDYSKIAKYNMKSDDPNYSSVKDGEQISFEVLKEHPDWNHNTTTEISEEIFIEYCKNTNKNYEEEKYKRHLDFTTLIALTEETKAVNHGENVLNINNLQSETVFIENIFNLHIISTPLRVVVTMHLQIEALKQDYNPIVLSIHGSMNNKYILKYRDDNNKIEEWPVDHIMSGGEFNNMLLKLINECKKNGINVDRPWIIIGNYFPTGESITYVHYDYGIVRSNTRLISTTPEADDQEFSRSNHTLSKFKENNPDFTQPKKFIIGEQKGIDNALYYEKINDILLDNMNNYSKTSTDELSVDLNDLHEKENIDRINGVSSTPCLIEVLDRENKYVKKLEIKFNKEKRSEEDKKKILKYLKKAKRDGAISFHDKTGKFDFNEFTINGLRGYKEGIESKEYRYRQYNNHYDTGTIYEGYKTKEFKKYECEILYCLKTYKDIDKKDNNLYINPTHKWWLSYKY